MRATDKEKVEEQETESSMKGTFFSVAVVGVSILITYVVVYGLYMFRV